MTLRTAITGLLDPTAGQHHPARSRPPAADPRPPGIYLGWGTRGPVLASPEHHVLILGPPRSGKTSRLLVPGVARHLGPAVVTSTKADVLAATVAARSRLGRCWYWDPSGTTVVPAGVEPLCWSPLDGCDTWDQAVARAYSLATAARPDDMFGNHWVERAQALLAALLHAGALSGGGLPSLLSWLHRRELTVPAAILEAHGAADVLQGVAHTDSRELSGIFSTTDSILAAYRTDADLRAARSGEFSPDLFAATTDTVYLVSPATTQAVHAALVVALLDQIRAATYRWHPRPAMLFALDEIANIAPLPALPAILAEGGSQGLTVAACLQDLSQARARWGKAADGFLTLFTHKIILPGIAERSTLQAVSDLAGETDIPVRSDSTQNSWPRQSSTTWSTRRQPRLPIDQVAAGRPGTAILISGTRLARVTL